MGNRTLVLWDIDLTLVDLLVHGEAVRPVHVLAVWAHRGDHGHGLFAVRPENVDGDRGAVPGRDGQVAVDPHGISLSQM
ncbi:hypothetical protein ACFQ1S_34480 [Kibdelosporangium lantanae]|uniref:Uncharacterized protein n=1 Tax=Kibdelosporangium lantanae TaxID=1497396 RepID=A0ABW3MLH5_9PSEU